MILSWQQKYFGAKAKEQQHKRSYLNEIHKPDAESPLSMLTAIFRNKLFRVGIKYLKRG
jgi:hypothetical protein